MTRAVDTDRAWVRLQSGGRLNLLAPDPMSWTHRVSPSGWPEPIDGAGSSRRNGGPSGRAAWGRGSGSMA